MRSVQPENRVVDRSILLRTVQYVYATVAILLRLDSEHTETKFERTQFAGPGGVVSAHWSVWHLGGMMAYSLLLPPMLLAGWSVREMVSMQV